MIYFLNGQFVPEAEATVSIMDRGFLYGDGLFETLRAWQGEFPMWDSHWERFSFGAQYLGISLPLSSGQLKETCTRLVERNEMREATLRITLTRGIGSRGYSPAGAEHPTLAITIHPVTAPKRSFTAITSRFALPSDDPIAGFKNCNKIRQILARAEADAAGADEAILLNEKGFAVEGSTTNLFWFSGEMLGTPPTCAGILPGVTRNFVLQIARELGWEFVETEITPAKLACADGLFLTASSMGCVPVSKLDGKPMSQHPNLAILQQAYEQKIRTLLEPPKT
ncbi:MAG: aminotransferase class IV [Verrucomicrobiales bacterium]